jgi:hypothetical protein
MIRKGTTLGASVKFKNHKTWWNSLTKEQKHELRNLSAVPRHTASVTGRCEVLNDIKPTLSIRPSTESPMPLIKIPAIKAPTGVGASRGVYNWNRFWSQKEIPA